jgi:hypothetical protein
MMPVVIPDRRMRRLLSASATGGTKGGEQMADTEVMMKVSTSTLSSRQSSACSAMPPKITVVTMKSTG